MSLTLTPTFWDGPVGLSETTALWYPRPEDADGMVPREGGRPSFVHPSCALIQKKGGANVHLPTCTSSNWIPMHECFAQLPGSVCTYLHLASSVQCRGRRKCLLCHRVCGVFHVCQQKHPRNRMSWEGRGPCKLSRSNPVWQPPNPASFLQFPLFNTRFPVLTPTRAPHAALAGRAAPPRRDAGVS